MHDAGNDATARAPFATIWAKLPARSELEAAGVLDTVTLNAPAADRSFADQVLPVVGHLAKMGECLGRGGNGEVISAQQLGLDRTIAVKRPLAGSIQSELSEILLREARVIGYLEHPSIPPVHFVGMADDETLLVGLKKIDGDNLHERLQCERGIENLEDNLDILIQVCNAIGFAHARGILHLDLKPENIMTGQHGEVYVLDWGLAVAYREGLAQGLPRPQADGQVRGTPGFIAPETVVAERANPATDVYQLGGILHYLLTREPPNRGSTSFEALRSAYEPGPRSFPDHLPDALVDICRKALAMEPQDRYEDANAMRDALAGYRRNRREVEALKVAQEQLAALRAILKSESGDSAEVYQAYGRARQAIDEAEQVRGKGEQTQRLLQSVIEELIRWELTGNNVGSASYLLSQLPVASADLAALVQQERDRLAEEMAELRALREGSDPSIGLRAKVLMVVALGFVIALSELVPHVLEIPPTPERLVSGYVIYLVLMFAASWRLREALLTTHLNRALTLSVWLLSANGFFLRLGSLGHLMPLHAVVGFDLLLCVLVDAYMGFLHDRRLLYALPIYIFFSLACFVWPGQALLLFGGAHLVGLSTVGAALAYVKVSVAAVDSSR